MMSIKQEPVEWSDFDHDNTNVNKSNIEVAVKPELIYSKSDPDDEGITIYVYYKCLFAHSMQYKTKQKPISNR